MAKTRIIGLVYQGTYSKGFGWDYLHACGHRSHGGLYIEKLTARITGENPTADCSECDQEAAASAS